MHTVQRGVVDVASPCSASVVRFGSRCLKRLGRGSQPEPLLTWLTSGQCNADNAYAEQLCNSLAQADETIHRREDVRAALYSIIDVLPPERQAKKREQK